MVSQASILNNYIHEHIPISNALGSQVKFASYDKVIVSAPFLPNVNHKSTVFGGSLHAIATLACWSLLYTNLIDMLGHIDLVICRSEVDYIKAVTKDFEAISIKPDISLWKKFEGALTKKGKGRIEMLATISQNEILAANYKGIFAAIKNK